MLNKVKKFIAKYQLLNKEKCYLVALSGGADSVSLLLVLHRLGYKINAVHCNFKLRGEESYRDEQFCIDLCNRHDIPLKRIHFDTTEYASLRKISIEMAARELRYTYFEQLRKSINAEGVCVGHHQEDSVETILLNLTRGTGIHGLTGIAPRNGNVLRPLLSCTRKDIETFIIGEGEHYVTDSSNLVSNVVRNKLRLLVIPLLKEINPSVQASIAQTAQYLSEAGTVADDALLRYFDKFGISHSKLYIYGSLSIPLKVITEFPSKKYFLFELLSPLGFNSEQISSISDFKKSMVGNIWQSEKYEITLDSSSLIVRKKELHADINKLLPETGLYIIDKNRSIQITYIDNKTIKKTDLSKEPCTVYIDADNITFPLILRNIAKGDRFVPFGMDKSKLVSDYLTNMKRNRFEKSDQLLLTDVTGKPLWLVGLRTDNRVKYTNISTKVLRIKYLEKTHETT